MSKSKVAALALVFLAWRSAGLALALTAAAFTAVAFGLWRWATATGSADTLEWVDARFARDRAIEALDRDIAAAEGRKIIRQVRVITTKGL